MKLQISDIIDKYNGKKCLVVCHGPSLNKYYNSLNQCKDNGYIIIGCNNWNEFYPQCPPHYWVMANTVDNCRNQMGLINQYKPVWVYADSVDITDHSWIEDQIQGDYLPYDQRHFGGKKCTDCAKHHCDKYFDPNRLTLQEELQKYTKFEQHYDSASTVALHQIALAILMGFEEIYIVGVDLDYHLGYANNVTGRGVPQLDHFDIYGKSILDDMEIVAKSAEKRGMKVYNLNKDSYWKLFPYKDLD